MADSEHSDSKISASALLVNRLARRDAFPHDVIDLEVLETHISWIILTGHYAYKIKKPVNLGFLDFSTLELRKYFCEEELRLNQRFAAQLYLDVVPVGGSPDQPVIGLEPAMDWAVRMRQFPADARLDRQLGQGLVSVADMQTLGVSIAQSHELAPAAPGDGAFGTADAVCQPTLDNFAGLRRDCPQPLLQAQINRLENMNASEIVRLRPVFQQRLEQARIRECHGDLHLANLVRLDNEIVAFDCLEFSPSLRWIDVISEVAFLVMDTLAHDKPDLAYAFLNRYLEVSGDYSGATVLPFYLAYRSLVRAKVAAVQHRQTSKSSDLASVTRYLDLATKLSEPEQKPVLIITHGLSGSGKTWLTSQLLMQIPAIRVRSDLERKRLHGLAGLEPSHSDVAGGIYSASASAETYSHLADIAGYCLSAGFNTIVDAAFLRQQERDRFRSLAQQQQLGFAILDCHASEATLRQRIEQRSSAGKDASEADLDVLAQQLATQHAIAETERRAVIDCDTEAAIDTVSLLSQIQAKRHGGSRTLL
jgi:aminoglycoside phosphotransferase family enzyme